MIDFLFLLAVVTVAGAIVQLFLRASMPDEGSSRRPAAARGDATARWPTAWRPGDADRRPLGDPGPARAGRAARQTVAENRVCGARGSLGNHPVGAPDWAGRTACPCGIVQVFPPGTAELPTEPPAGIPGEDAGDRARRLPGAERGSVLSHRNTERSARRPAHPNRQRHPIGPGAVVVDLDAARQVRLRRTT